MTQGARAEGHLMHMYMEAASLRAIGNNCKSKINQTLSVWKYLLGKI